VTILFDFESLIDDFSECKAFAKNLQPPNAEDHHRIKLAMVGFSRNSDLKHWEHQHYEFVQNRLSTDLSPEEFTPVWIDFACVAMGYLLGLVASGTIKTDSEFQIADAQLPGFMWLHAAEIEALNINTDRT
jgi:hypothetical protein